MNPKHVKNLETIAKQAMEHPGKNRAYIDRAFEYVNEHITGDEAGHRMKYIRLFYDRIRNDRRKPYEP